MHFSLGPGLNPVCETGTSIIAGSIQRRDETDSSILEAWRTIIATGILFCLFHDKLLFKMCIWDATYNCCFALLVLHHCETQNAQEFITHDAHDAADIGSEW